jgi:hypothetical protein
MPHGDSLGQCSPRQVSLDEVLRRRGLSPMSLAPWRYAPSRIAPLRSASLRFVPLRSGRMEGFVGWPRSRSAEKPAQRSAAIAEVDGTCLAQRVDFAVYVASVERGHALRNRRHRPRPGLTSPRGYPVKPILQTLRLSEILNAVARISHDRRRGEAPTSAQAQR